jgi:hypothetical protein
MLNLDTTEWLDKLERMKLKELYRLCEMCHLQQSIGKEEAIPPHPHPTADPGSFLAIHVHGQSQTRKRLGQMAWSRINELQWVALGDEPVYVWDYYQDEGAPGFTILWDHWQPYFACICRLQHGSGNIWDYTDVGEPLGLFNMYDVS